ncbi:MAG TPA: DUF222 domain-containing protein [Micromonosporaceae bacterium]
MSTRDVATLVQRLRADLAELAALAVPEVADDVLVSSLPELLAARRGLDGVVLTLLGSFDVRGLAEVDGYRATRTWLTVFGRMSQGAASGLLANARLVRQMPALADAATSGRASAEQLTRVSRLAARVGVAQLGCYDQILAELTAATGPAEVHRACQRIHAHLDPDAAAPDPERDLARRQLTLSRSGTMVYLRGCLDAEAGAALSTALDALMRPPTADDQRTPPQRRADALAELARHALTHNTLPSVGGSRPHLGILITPSTLLGQDPRPGTHNRAANTGDDGLSRAGVPPRPEPPWLNWVGEVHPELAQRLACDSDIWRAILDPTTALPLNLGRTQRTVPTHLRRALHARDRGCRWPGCDAPTSWTDAHHLLPWYHGGPTNIDNLVLFCRYHHTKVHEGHWHAELDPATGELHITRPDGRRYQPGPSQPWLSPNCRRTTPPDAGAA